MTERLARPRAGGRAARRSAPGATTICTRSISGCTAALQQGRGPGLGAQPLLLPGDDPDQGRRLIARHATIRRCAAPGASGSIDHDGDERADGEGGIDRWLALTDGARARPRPTWCPLAASCRRRASPSTPMSHFVRERSLLEADRLLADRAVLAADHRRARRRHAGALRLRRPRQRWPISPRARRRPQRDVDFALAYVLAHAATPRDQAGGDGGARVQDATCSGRSWTRCTCLCGARPPPGAWRPHAMSAGDSDDASPRLPRGVRLRQDPARNGWLLLAPERVFELNADSRRDPAALRRRAQLREIVDELAGELRRRPRADRGGRPGAARTIAGQAMIDLLDRALPAPGRAAGRADPSLPAGLPLLLEPARARPARPTSSTPPTWAARVRRGGRARRACSCICRAASRPPGRDLVDLVAAAARGRASTPT